MSAKASDFIKVLFRLLILITAIAALSACKFGSLRGVSKVVPVVDTHMHGQNSKPHTHLKDHRHNFVCMHKGKEYPSTVSCGLKHMHGADSVPHIHKTSKSEGARHGQGFQCQYKGQGKILPSDKDCGLHKHDHLHGLRITESDLHGTRTVPHRHNHQHKGDHVHRYKCIIKGQTYSSTKSCEIKHDHPHMHGATSKPHSHIHDHSGDHAHINSLKCLGPGNDHNYYYSSNSNCYAYDHTHKMMYGPGSKPVSKKHSHGNVNKRYRAHPYKCTFEGNTYGSYKSCEK